jgi:hypothetical protein
MLDGSSIGDVLRRCAVSGTNARGVGSERHMFVPSLPRLALVFLH